MCMQTWYHWHEHRKRAAMDEDELQQHQLKTRQLRLELSLQALLPIKVVARGFSGRDYLQESPNITWNGLNQIRDVAAAIFWNEGCKNGAEIQVYKKTRCLRHDTRLEKLCDLCGMRRRIELTVVINRANRQMNEEV